MSDTTVKTQNTIIIFFPFELRDINRCYLYGDFESFDDVKLFFITKVFETFKSKTCLSLGASKSVVTETSLKFAKDWIYVEIKGNVLTVKSLKIQGNFQDVNSYHILWINYDFKVFSKCGILPSDTLDPYSNESYFNYFKQKVNLKLKNDVKKKSSETFKMKNRILGVFCMLLLKLSNCNLKQLPITKYFNIALHIDSYLEGLHWAMKLTKEKQELDIKAVNLVSSILLDMILGVLFLQWLNSRVSLESSPTIFLFTAETVVNSIRDLIKWLRGDPAGLKLNWALSNVLAAFFSFHIDIWWTFIAYLKPVVKIIFHIFLKLGLLGITFQASITADLLALVSFHVYCIYAYAAKLYSIQVSTLISLWRLFLGRKKNPLRGKVDSCKYSPEQLFVGTLGFTILLFLLPTTLLYYVVFACIRLTILTMTAILMGIRYLNQTLPVYSTLLWLLRSPRISTEVEILPYDSLKSDIILLTVKPVTCSWWETVIYFTPDCVAKPSGFNISDLLRSLLSGKLIYPL